MSSLRDSNPPPVIGMGCMRLSTDRDRDEGRAIAVLHAAFDAGITFLDTADAYCWDASETGHNERLIARALAAWTGDRASVRVATKGGLTRPDGRWVPNARARHLAAACEASRRALGVERIHLYQLHAPDPRTPLATSVRALAALQRDGLVESIGLCNVTVGQIEEARGIADIASVQAELGIWNDANILSGVAEYCIANGITLIAHRPLGGPQRRHRTASDPALLAVAARHDATPFEIALAWLTDLSELVLPIPGPTSVEHARSIARARSIRLTDEDRAQLPRRERSQVPPPATSVHGEVVLIMGLPAAGKSTLAATFVAKGYERLNRDEAGGSLRELMPAMDRLIASGTSRIVLDNTYVSRKSRAAVIQTAHRRGLPVRCVWLSTSVEDAQINAAWRGAAFLPTAQFRYQRELEPPDAAEGFSQIDVVPFARRHDPSFVNRAVIVWCDGVLLGSRSGRRTPSSADDVEVVTERGEILRRYQDEGWSVLGLSWQPGVADETLSPTDVDASFARMRDLLGLDIEVEYCPHGAGPPTCWCRKPLPGLAVRFIQRHRLDASQCIYVGAGPQDPGFARRLGFIYHDAADFFAL